MRPSTSSNVSISNLRIRRIPAGTDLKFGLISTGLIGSWPYYFATGRSSKWLFLIDSVGVLPK